MGQFGFHPSMGDVQVQISRKDEVKRAIKFLEFRKY